MTYQYKGKDYRVVNERLISVVQVGEFDNSLCGTYAGYRRHHRRGHAICQPCRDARNANQRERYAALSAAQLRREYRFDVSKCGTYAGYRRHSRYGVKVCKSCLVAYADYMHQYRASKKAAA